MSSAWASRAGVWCWLCRVFCVLCFVRVVPLSCVSSALCVTCFLSYWGLCDYFVCCVLCILWYVRCMCVLCFYFVLAVLGAQCLMGFVRFVSFCVLCSLSCAVSYVFHVFCVLRVLCIFAWLSSLCPGLETQEVEGGQDLRGLGGALLQKGGAESHTKTSGEGNPESVVSGGPPIPLKGGQKHWAGLRGALYSVST